MSKTVPVRTQKNLRVTGRGIPRLSQRWRATFLFYTTNLGMCPSLTFSQFVGFVMGEVVGAVAPTPRREKSAS